VGAVSTGNVVAVNPGISDPSTLALFAAGAANVQRQNIAVVPGSGSVLGVFYINGKTYAFRNNAGGTAVALYVSSSTGWTLVPFGRELSYSSAVGTTTPVVGQALVGATSGTAAVIAAVINQTGGVTSGLPLWAGSTGRFILGTPTGSGFVNGELLQISGVTVATASSLATVIAPAPSGKYVIDVAAFGGGTSTTNVAYGASGVDRAFSFDPTPTTAFPLGVYAPITTGSVPDTPQVARKHLNYLLVGIQNSLQISGLGLPFQWTPLSGGAEILLQENITNLMPLPGNQATGALAIFSQNYTYILYGSSQSTFQLVPYNIKAGAYFNTAANLADVYMFETRGITSMTTTLQYGNFEPSYVTMNIKPFIDAHQQNVTCAIVDREKSQYRVFFSDGYGLSATFLNKQYAGCIPLAFPNPVLTVCDGVDPVTGQQLLFFGSSNGYVYQLEKGTSFDGSPIQAFLQFVFNSMKSHRVLKRYRKTSLEISGSQYCFFSTSYSLGYGLSTVGQPGTTNYAVPFTQAFWDSFTWDSFTWDGTNLAPQEIEMAGTAENISLYILSNTDLLQPFTINTATIHYTIRRGIR